MIALAGAIPAFFILFTMVSPWFFHAFPQIASLKKSFMIGSCLRLFKSIDADVAFESDMFIRSPPSLHIQFIVHGRGGQCAHRGGSNGLMHSRCRIPGAIDARNVRFPEVVNDNHSRFRNVASDFSRQVRPWNQIRFKRDPYTWNCRPVFENNLTHDPVVRVNVPDRRIEYRYLMLLEFLALSIRQLVRSVRADGKPIRPTGY